MKPIHFDVAIKTTVRKYHVERRQEISVGDSAILEFEIIDMQPKELTDTIAEVNLLMADGSMFPLKDVSLTGNVFFCALNSKQTNHGGVAKAQIVISSGEDKAASEICEFGIVATLEGKAIAEVVIPDLTAVKKEIKSAEMQLKEEAAAVIEEVKSTEMQLKNSVIANNEVVDMLLRHTLTLTDDYGQDWEITVDTDGTLKTVRKGVN